MYVVFIFVFLFCKTFLFVKGDFVNVNSEIGKDGKGLTVKMDGSFDIAELLGFYMDNYPSDKDSVIRIHDSSAETTKSHLRIRDPSPETTKSHHRKRKIPADIKIKTMVTKVDVLMTQIEEMAVTTHKVKDSKIVHEFTLHVFKQAMKVFDSIRQKTNNNEGKRKISALAKSYQQKFTDFVQRTREYDVRTGLGDQKVVLNTIDTSVLILQRLINFLKSESRGSVGNDDSTPELNVNTGISDDMLQKEVDTEKEMEYHHVCVKYNYCRSAFGLKHVLQNVVKTLATAPDDKLTQAVDAITEVLKTAEIDGIVDSRSEITFKEKLNRFEKTTATHARLAMNIILDALTNLNAPIEVAPENADIAKKTTAFYNIVNELDSAIPANERNKLEWADIEKSLDQWSKGERSDIQDILQALLNNINRGIKEMSPESSLKIRNQFNTS